MIYMPKLAYFCAPEEPNAFASWCEGMRAHFAESLDAVFVPMTPVGRELFSPAMPREHTCKRVTADFELVKEDRKLIWHKRCRQGLLPAPVGASVFAGRLYPELIKLDAALDGPQPVGTRIRVIAEDTDVPAGVAQDAVAAIPHADASQQSLVRGVASRVFDLESVPELTTEHYWTDAATQPLVQNFVKRYAHYRDTGRTDLVLQLVNTEEFRRLNEQIRHRMRKAPGYSLTVRTDHSTHTAVRNITGQALRRQRARMIVARPNSLA